MIPSDTLRQAWSFLLQHLKRGVWLLDSEGHIIEANAAMHKWLEVPDLTGLSAAEFLVATQLDEHELVSRTGVRRKIVIESGRVGESTIQIFADQSLVRVMESRLVEEIRRVSKLAGEDPLTGVGNRRAFDEALTAMLGEIGKKFGVIVVDADDFKAVNDSYGHKVGDEVLKSLAHKIQTLVRSDDIVSRIGGDEFAVLLPNVNMAVLTEVAERLRNELVVEAQGKSFPFKVYASVGYAHSGPDPSTVVERADKWMYQNKVDRESGGLAALAEREA